MSKVAEIEEMYLIYQAMQNYLAGTESRVEYPLTEHFASYRSFCQWEPIGGLFLEYLFEEMMERVKDGG